MSNDKLAASGIVGRPLTKAQSQAEHDAWKARWEAAQNEPLTVLHSAVGGQASGWYTIPKPIRFAGWVWAILTIIWVAGITIGGILWLVFAVLVFGGHNPL